MGKMNKEERNEKFAGDQAPAVEPETAPANYPAIGTPEREARLEAAKAERIAEMEARLRAEARAKRAARAEVEVKREADLKGRHAQRCAPSPGVAAVEEAEASSPAIAEAQSKYDALKAEHQAKVADYGDSQIRDAKIEIHAARIAVHEAKHAALVAAAGPARDVVTAAEAKFEAAQAELNEANDRYRAIREGITSHQAQIKNLGGELAALTSAKEREEREREKAAEKRDRFLRTVFA